MRGGGEWGRLILTAEDSNLRRLAATGTEESRGFSGNFLLQWAIPVSAADTS